MGLKTCRHCGLATITASQAKRRRCGPCKAAYDREWRSKNPNVRARELARWHARKTDPVERVKRQARKITENSINRGDLVRGPCEVCGDPKSEAHHNGIASPQALYDVRTGGGRLCLSLREPLRATTNPPSVSHK